MRNFIVVFSVGIINKTTVEKNKLTVAIASQALCLKKFKEEKFKKKQNISELGFEKKIKVASHRDIYRRMFYSYPVYPPIGMYLPTKVSGVSIKKSF